MPSPADEPSTPPPPRLSPRHWGALAVAAALHSLYVIAQWGEAYIDFGDGNYMYIATRIADGIVPYRDMLAPQPPCHLFLGALIVAVSRALRMETPLYIFRALSLLIHLASAWLVVDLARRAWGCARTGVLAGAFFLALPIGLWWSMGWQSEPLEILFLLAMMRLALAPSRRNDILAGLFGALAALTNATAAPFLLVLIVYMFAANWRRALRLAVPAIALAAVVTIPLEIWTSGAYLRNVVFDQAGTYPPEGFLLYTLPKMLREGADILWLDGSFVFLALAGFFRLLSSSPLPREERGGLAWFCAATLASFLYVSKGGTVDYIFSLSEPAVAILAAGALVGIAGWFKPAEGAERLGLANAIALWLAGFALAATLGLGPAASHYVRLWNGLAFELPDYDDRHPKINNVAQVKEWIDRHTKPGDTILAPPYYAFITHRKIWGEYCEIFIWSVKYKNDTDNNNPQGEGWTKARAMAEALERKELPLVIIELGQTGRLSEVMAALEKSYRPILQEPYQTLNTQLGVYVPK